MKQTIRLTESELKKVISESVRNILNELSYSKVKDAHDKMYELGQYKRAHNLAKTFADVYNDEDAEYDIHGDNLILKGPEGPQTIYHRTIDKEVNNINARTCKPDNYSDRTTNAGSARNRAKHVNNFAGKQIVDKNRYRA